MLFKKLRLHDWRQFANVDIQFDRHLTVLTGPNGSGKTIALSILAAHYGVIQPFTSIPAANGKEFQNDILIRPHQTMDVWFGEAIEVGKGKHQVETMAPIIEVTFVDDSVTQLTAPFKVRRTYNLGFNRTVEVAGLHFGAFDLAPAPQSFAEEEIEFGPVTNVVERELLKPMHDSLGKNDARSFQRELKRSILRWLTVVEENESARPAQRVASTVAVLVREKHKLFESYLAACLPVPLGFRGFERRGLDFVVKTSTAEFSFDASSSGISRVITLIWRIFLMSLVIPEFVVTIDEPENHLHPAMQQSLLIGLVENFPNVQFVVATHSPFMITATPDASVYAFKIDGRDVTSKLMHPTQEGAITPDEVFQDVLGLPFTMPIWAARSVETYKQASKSIYR